MPASLRSLVARADCHPDAERQRLDVAHGVADDAQSIGKCRDLGAHRVAAPAARLCLLHMRLDRFQVVGENGEALLVVSSAARRFGRRGRSSGDGFDGVRELRRMRGRKDDLRRVRRRSRLGERDPAASGVRIHDVAAVPPHAAIAAATSASDAAAARKLGA